MIQYLDSYFMKVLWYVDMKCTVLQENRSLSNNSDYQLTLSYKYVAGTDRLLLIPINEYYNYILIRGFIKYNT